MMRALAAMLLLVAALGAHAQSPLAAAGVDQRPGAQLALDAPMADEQGRAVHLADYFGRLPVVLIFAYYDCPNLCGLLLTDAVRSLRDAGAAAGRDYELVVVDIDAREAPGTAAHKKAAYVRAYGADYVGGAHFLTGAAGASRRIAASAGFRYVFDAKASEYVHPAGLLVATPEGRVSRYLLGLRFPAQVLRVALADARGSRIGALADRVWLLCHHYDPQTGRYTSLILDWLRGLALLSMAGLAVLIVRLRPRA